MTERDISATINSNMKASLFKPGDVIFDSAGSSMILPEGWPIGAVPPSREVDHNAYVRAWNKVNAAERRRRSEVSQIKPTRRIIIGAN